MGFDVGIDLGTSMTRIFLANKGIVVNEPSVIAVDNDDTIVAVGKDAYAMLGRTSSRIRAEYPLSGGVISDLGLVEAMISEFLKRIATSKIGLPRAVACVPSDITDVERRAVVHAITNSGIRSVELIEEPVAAALGAGIDINTPHGAFVIDIGGGTADFAVISLNGIAVSRSIKFAGNVMDDEIMKYVKKKYGMLIGKRTSEEAKIAVGCVIREMAQGRYRVKGRSIVTGMPAYFDLDSYETIEPLYETALKIVRQVQDVLEETPPELIGDIYTDGIVMTGGGSKLRGLAAMIAAVTKLRVRIADEPSECVVKGCGAALRYLGCSDDTVSPFMEY